MVLIWAVIVSAIPLTASAWLLSLFILRPLSTFLPDSLHGSVEIGFDGYIKMNNQKQSFLSVSDLHSFAFLSFHARGKHWLLWRDSCEKVTYRQLLVRLKRKQEP